MNKKKLLSLALVVVMIAILSFGTLAWFNDADEVTNKFMVAGSEDKDPDEIFSVDVWEETPEEDKDDDGYDYEDILPGDQLKKVAHVENTGSYNQYIRVVVEISDAAAWQNALAENFNDETLIACFAGYDADLWRHESTAVDAAKDVIRVTLYYNGGNKENRGIVAPGDVITVFTGVNIPTSLTQAQAAEFAGGFEIKVTADAVQTENLGVNTEDTICDAYEAFVAANMA